MMRASYMKDRRRLLKAQGRCIWCSDGLIFKAHPESPIKGSTCLCLSCLQRQRLSSRQRKGHEEWEEGSRGAIPMEKKGIVFPKPKRQR